MGDKTGSVVLSRETVEEMHKILNEFEQKTRSETFASSIVRQYVLSHFIRPMRKGLRRTQETNEVAAQETPLEYMRRLLVQANDVEERLDMIIKQIEPQAQMFERMSSEEKRAWLGRAIRFAEGIEFWPNPQDDNNDEPERPPFCKE